ncbi:MAG: hypothetical protein IID34_07380 [Planctomycetes bacterium]|nr:hypothetical protein [Planctomycetota bacterium]
MPPPNEAAITPAAQNDVPLTELSTLPAIDGALLEKVIMGDLSGLTPADRVRYVVAVCRSTGLNPTTRPFEYVKLNGRLVLYPTKSATEQLRKIHGVGITIVDRKKDGDLFTVVVRAEMPNGRSDESLGAVSVKGLSAQPLADAMMKAETKAKRRATLSICGLGCLDVRDDPMMAPAPTDNVEVPEDELRKRIRTMLLEMAHGDLDAARHMLVDFSGFDDDGKTVAGVGTTHQLHGRWLRATYGKIKAAHAEFNDDMDHAAEEDQTDDT